MQPRPARLLLALALTGVLAACADPVDENPGQGEAAENPIGSEEPDPARDALIAEVETLVELLATARDHLAGVAEVDGVAAARQAGTDAVDLLIGDPAQGPPALFPVETPEQRGDGGDREDQLTTVLTLSREAGGGAGGAVRETMRDLVAGDLGTWQRDAGGMVEIVEETATTTGSLEEIEVAVFDLPGEATRALAWALLTRDANDLEAAGDYAERGAAHLDVAVTALSELDLEPA